MRHTRRNQHQAEPTPGRTNTRKINISTATLLQAKRAQDQHLQPTSSRLQHQTSGEQHRDQQTVFPENQKKPKPTNRAKKSTIWLRIVQPPTAEDNSSLKKHSDRMVMDFAQCVVRHATKEII